MAVSIGCIIYDEFLEKFGLIHIKGGGATSQLLCLVRGEHLLLAHLPGHKTF